MGLEILISYLVMRDNAGCSKRPTFRSNLIIRKECKIILNYWINSTEDN